ncbi:MAG: hypothetical protein IJR85_09110 [Synergistaceae bacterium]|nr:hypothetical protein [Synergistaceae bacterium]
MMKEIGGYFGLEDFAGREYYPELVAVNHANNGLAYLIKARKIRKLYIPCWLCSSVAGLCRREGCEFEYYHAGEDFLPEFGVTLGEGEYLYVVNYYGQLEDDVILELRARHGNIILDNVQAFFARPIAGIDTLYSCRKFFGVPDGGYVSTEARLPETLPVDVSMNRMKHVLGRFEVCASEYYADFAANEKTYRDLELRGMSKLTHNLLRAIDYEAVRRKREKNFGVLHELLGETNRLKVHAVSGPYMYPYYCEDGVRVRRELQAKKIYISKLWPGVPEEASDMEKDYAENILPLPVDQRYSPEDMRYVVGELRSCL